MSLSLIFVNLVAHGPLRCALCSEIVLMLCLQHNSWEIPPLLSVLLSDKTSLFIQFHLVNDNEDNNVSEKVLGEKCYLDTKNYSGKKIHLTPVCVKCPFVGFFSRCADRKTQREEQSARFEWSEL